MKESHPWLLHLSTLHPKDMDLTLERVTKVGKALGVLKPSCPVVLVAGTNGKGSTIHALSLLLQQAGLRVGCYTSPHIRYFNERIRINGQCIDDASLEQAFEAVESHRDGTSLTYFEFTTLAAFWAFQQRPLDIVVAEIGLGGRLDAVNIMAPDLAIICSIGLDHQQWLGQTLNEIAAEKAGILRKNKPCIISAQANLPAITATIEALTCHAKRGGQDFFFQASNHQDKENSADTWCYDGDSITVPSHCLPKDSVSLALAAYQKLSSDIIMNLPSLSSVISALQGAVLTGRFSQVQSNPDIILDVAHNIPSCQRLKAQLDAAPQKRRIAVWAMLDDKNVEDIAGLLGSCFDAWFVPQLEHARACSQSRLVESLRAQGIEEIFAASSTTLAYEALQEYMNDTDQIIVFGSFITVSEFLEAMSNGNRL